MLYNTRFSYFTYQYHFNNKEFTEKYCVNKDKPELKCNGKCELSKIAKAAEQEQKNTKHSSDLDITFFIHSAPTFEILKINKEFLPIQISCNKHNYKCLNFLDPPPKINFQVLT